MSYTEDAYERQYEAWMEQERQWYDLIAEYLAHGWHHGKLHRHLDQSQRNDIVDWLVRRHQDQWQFYNDEVLLPTAQDLTWFLITWA
jgi:hypothetical protein